MSEIEDQRAAAFYAFTRALDGDRKEFRQAKEYWATFLTTIFPHSEVTHNVQFGGSATQIGVTLLTPRSGHITIDLIVRAKHDERMVKLTGKVRNTNAKRLNAPSSPTFISRFSGLRTLPMSQVTDSLLDIFFKMNERQRQVEAVSSGRFERGGLIGSWKEGSWRFKELQTPHWSISVSDHDSARCEQDARMVPRDGKPAARRFYGLAHLELKSDYTLPETYDILRHVETTMYQVTEW